MKALKVILIIVVVLVAAILIVPLFSPATASLSAETTIAREPAEIFPVVASYADREIWDPWVTLDSTTDVHIESQPGYVGSTYSWDGQKIGSGHMEVVSVMENRHIESSLNFSDMDTPSVVEWDFKPVDGGTRVTWSFSQETTYPFSRLGMIFGKIFLKKSFDLGLANLKKYMESMPKKTRALGNISVETLPAMQTLVADGAGTLEAIGEQMGELYPLLFTEAGLQQLEITGAPFAEYLDFDESTGFSNYRAGIVVDKAGSDAGVVKAVAYPEMEAVQAIHTGPYEDFVSSYEILEAYIQEHGIQTNGKVFEFYRVGMESESDPALWKTLIAFPIQ
jgi:AraC family transcriptional regulator